MHDPASDKDNERRKNFELRAIIEFLAESGIQANKSPWQCISEIYILIQAILKEGKDLSVSQDLLATFETNRRVIEDIYNAPHLKAKKLSNPLTAYFVKFLDIKNRFLQSRTEVHREPLPENIDEAIDQFLREYVVCLIKDPRVVFLLLVTLIYRKLQNQSTVEFKQNVSHLTKLFEKHEAQSDRLLTLLIYNLCQASVDAIEETDYGHASVYCERAVELFKMLGDGSKVKDAIRSQIEDAMRITAERLVNRIQEHEEAEQIQNIESLVERLVNIDLIAYLLPKLVFFLIRAQKYEDCLHHLDRILEAEDLSSDFMDYQTAITIGYEWCDSLLKAERYSRGKVDFSFFQKEKENIYKVFLFSKAVIIPDMEDETFYNVETEKLAVTFSHLGTLFFLTGRVDMAAESYKKSFETILQKRCSRNRDSVDEIMDRYKDTIHHPLNSAPMEAHSLIGIFASEKGYDYLLNLQLKKWDEEGRAYNREEQNFSTLVNEQKQMLADLMDSTQNKLKMRFSEPYAGYKEFIVNNYNVIKNRMQI
ncbi:hypothetical protein JNM05_00315 [bacterium]|nr:hypothetical protein [bacterium]